MIRDHLLDALRGALVAADLPEPPGGLEIDATRQREHGDFQTNAALKLAKAVGRPPRDIAAALVSTLDEKLPRHVARLEVAGPGFVNFHLEPSWLHEVLVDVVVAGDEYGHSAALDGLRVNLEFVSANPTGPLHAGGARWAAVGDALANLLSSQGAQVHREYYVNDAGAQLDRFAESLHARFKKQKLPEDGYRGAYVLDMARRMRAELGNGLDLEQAREWGHADIMRQLHDDLGRIGVHFDTWFSERSLHERGDVDAVIARFLASGRAFETDGAVWLRTSEMGEERDRVLRRSDGTPTYLAADVAYHLDKLARGHAHLIDIWGADHQGQVRSLQLAMEMATGRSQTPEVVLGQFVTLVRHGREVRISKRTGNVITLADILDEVDADVARLTFLLQSIDTKQIFDIDVVTAQSMENPVYYVQYAHARIASIGRRAAERSLARRPLGEVDLSLLVHERELDLLRTLFAYPDVLADAAEARAPHRVTTWVRELAGRFHGFYHDCRVMLDDDPALTQSRLWLAEACRLGFANALAILGVSAPETMSRLDETDDTDDADGSPDEASDGRSHDDSGADRA